MPVQYRSVIAEHTAVRQDCGWFDVSHLGRARVSGPGAVEAISRTFSNDIAGLEPLRTQYTLCLNDRGGIIDDVIIWSREDDHLVLPNAGNSDRVLSLLSAHPGVAVEDLRPHTFSIAVQGPRAPEVLERVVGVAPRRSHVLRGELAGAEIQVGGTGYTGERGGEIIGPPEIAHHLIEQLEAAGATPCGLGARDTLRLEAGLPLWGQDIDESTTPYEAGLGFAVDLSHHFVGDDALETPTVSKRLVGFSTDGRLIPRPHHRLRAEDGSSGEVTSGNFSPTLGHGIGMGYVDPAATALEVEIRGEWHPVVITRMPFYRR